MPASAVRLREQVSNRPATPDRRGQGRNPVGDRRTDPAATARLVENELLRAYARNHLKVSPYQLLLVGAIAWLASAWIPFAALLPGTVLVAATVVAERFCCRTLLRQEPAIVNPSRWRVGFILGELVQGAGWIIFALPLLARPSPSNAVSSGDAFVLVTVLLLTGAAAVLRSPLPSAVGAAVAPLVLLIAFMSARGSGDGHGTLALLVLSGQAFLAYVAHRLHRFAAATLRTQVQIQASFAEVERIAASTTEAYRRAEEADRVKTQFFATMSHELRTPLNAILGFSEVMKNEVLGSHSTPSYREYSSDIHGSGQQLLALINGILDLSRIASGQYTLREETSDLGLLVKASLDALSAAALAKSHEITLSIAPDLDPIRVDAAAVGQIVANLVSNAIKFTGPGGQIDVRVGWTSRGGQYVSVTDDGPGIPAEEIPLVLSSFGRGSLAVSNAEPGVGLGLPVARGLVELHGGRLILNSTLRKGTQATVVFPAVRCAKARPTLASPDHASDGLET